MTMDDHIDAGTTGTDRRTALKRAAIAAGVVAWTTPVVQAVTARPAHAGAITNCTVNVTAIVSLTGSDCQCVSGCNDDSGDCCDNNSFTFDEFAVGCGPLCNVQAEVDLRITNSVRCECAGSPVYADCDNVTVSGSVTCGDVRQEYNDTPIPADCFECTALASAPAVAGEPQLTPTEDQEVDESVTEPTPVTTADDVSPAGEAPPAGEPPAEDVPPSSAASPVGESQGAETGG